MFTLLLLVILGAFIYCWIIKPELGAKAVEKTKRLFDRGGASRFCWALLAVGLLASPAMAQTCPTITPERLADSAAAQGDKVVVLDAAQRAIITKHYNDTEPKSNDVFDHVMVLVRGNARLVVFFRDGCAHARGALTGSELAEILGKDA